MVTVPSGHVGHHRGYGFGLRSAIGGPAQRTAPLGDACPANEMLGVGVPEHGFR